MGSALAMPVAALVLAPAAAVLTRRLWCRPALGLAAAIALIAVPGRTGGEDAALVHLTPADVGVAAVIGLVLTRTLIRSDEEDVARLRSWVLLPMAAVVFSAALATFTAGDGLTSLSGLVRYVQLFVLVPLVTYLAVRRRQDLRLLLAAVLGLGLVEAIIGIVQYLSGTGASFGAQDVRAVGTFGAYSILALSWVVTLALIVATALAVSFDGAQRWFAIASVGLLSVALAFSLSRGAWIAAVVGVLAVLALHDRTKALLVVLGVAAALSVAAVTTPNRESVVVERLASTSAVFSQPDQSVRDRYALWQAALGMWRDRPLTGVGIKNFPRHRDSYVAFEFSGKSDIADAQGGFRQVALLSPHNLYLLILAEQGVVGALAYLSLFLGLGWAALQRVQHGTGPPIERAFGLATLGFLASYLVSHLYNDVGGVTGLLNAILLGGLVWLGAGTRVQETT